MIGGFHLNVICFLHYNILVSEILISLCLRQQSLTPSHYFQELDILSSGIQWDVIVDLTKSGKLDAIAVWFDLHLDEDISISTDPTNKNCWEQAIFPVLPSNFCHCHNGKGIHIYNCIIFCSIDRCIFFPKSCCHI